MTVIVTGAEGFIGKHLCAALERRGTRVYKVDSATGDDVRWCTFPDATRVYHLAAQVDAYCNNAYLDADINIMGTLQILRDFGDKVVLASSSMVNYPVNPYAISKRAAEDYARMYGAGVVRFCNIFGAGGHSFIERCEQNDRITIYGSGEQKRTWRHVSAAVEALLDVDPGELRVLDGDDWTINEIARRYGKPIDYQPARPGDLLDATQVRVTLP